MAAAGPGSGFLPFIVGVFVGLIGLALLSRQWSKRPREKRPAPFWDDRAGRRVAGASLLVPAPSLTRLFRQRRAGASSQRSFRVLLSRVAPGAMLAAPSGGRSSRGLSEREAKEDRA
jgi:hypothetical protein